MLQGSHIAGLQKRARITRSRTERTSNGSAYEENEEEVKSTVKLCNGGERRTQ
jgi:hypothetical protein